MSVNLRKLHYAEFIWVMWLMGWVMCAKPVIQQVLKQGYVYIDLYSLIKDSKQVFFNSEKYMKKYL